MLTEKQEQAEQILQLKAELEQEKERFKEFEQILKRNDSQTATNSVETEQQKQLVKELTELRNKIPRLEAENLSVHQEVKKKQTLCELS